MECLNCSGKEYERTTLFARSLSREDRFKDSQQEFEVLICKNCYLSQWYDAIILSGNNREHKQFLKPKYGCPELAPFECLNCGSHDSLEDRVEIIPHAFTSLERAQEKMFGMRGGSVLFRICSKCALIETYSIVLTRTEMFSDARYVKEIGEIARQIKCPTCESSKIDAPDYVQFFKKTGQMFMGKEKQAAKEFLYFVFLPCKYVFFFDSVAIHKSGR